MSQTWYLKYRPQKISDLDLVEVRESLGKILESKNIPHAWLFTGPRGTGKTSSARILAKEVNGNDKELNLEIETGSSPDVIEIDAASNRGIDEIRDLRDKIKLSPMRAHYKVYIIDEVHMLTTEAANALLKTLEEPPAHAIFVLCTTEAEKLPETVISRCTRIQFKKPSLQEIIQKLKIISKNEKLEIKDEELELVAKASKGSFRDAIKILEQTVLSGKTASEVLGMLEGAEPEKFIKFLRDKDTVQALKFIDNLMNLGISPKSFIEGCIEELREELLRTLDKSNLLLIEMFEKVWERTKNTAVPQLPLEIMVIEINPNITPHPPLSLRGGDPKGEGDIPRNHKKNTGGKYNLEDVVAKWPEILQAVKPKNHSVEALLRSTKPIAFDGEELTLEVFYKFHKDKLESEKCRQIVEQGVGEVFAIEPVRLMLKLGERQKIEKTEEDIIKTAEEIFKVDKVSNPA